MNGPDVTSGPGNICKIIAKWKNVCVRDMRVFTGEWTKLTRG